MAGTVNFSASSGDCRSGNFNCEMSRMHVSIIIPVYNEVRTLPAIVHRVRAAALPPSCTREIIVVDDGSSDGTAQLIEEYVSAGILIGYQATSNRGKGSAIREGIRCATGDIILIQDGDLEYDPNDYIAMVTPIVRGEVDTVYGSRFLGTIAGMNWRNWLANKILTFTANALYAANITDEATAYKAFRTEVLRRVDLKCQRFEFCPEVTAKLSRLGYKIREVPIRYHARTPTQGKKVRTRDGFEAFWTLIKYRFVSRKNLTKTTF